MAAKAQDRSFVALIFGPARQLAGNPREYTKLSIYVTEVRYCSADYVNPERVVNDPERVAYLEEAFRRVPVTSNAASTSGDIRMVFPG